MEGLFPTLHHVAVFDTAYHGTIPEFAHRYAVPNHLYTEHHLRKYGFHGTSHKYINQEVARIWDKAVLNTGN